MEEIKTIPKDVLGKAKKIGNIFEVINKIEELVSNDFCFDIEFDSAFKRLETDKERKMAEIIGRVYMISHAWNPKHSCYNVHEDWRESTFKKKE